MRVNWNNKQDTVDFAGVRPGHCFKYNMCLYIKCGLGQNAVRVTDGMIIGNMCGRHVVPINAEIQVID